MSRNAHAAGDGPNPATAGRGGDIVAAVQGVLIDGPGAGQVVDAGEPPLRRAVLVPGDGGFGERAYRYYLESVDSEQANYRFAGQVEWPPEARGEVVRRLTDQRLSSAEASARGQQPEPAIETRDGLPI